MTSCREGVRQRRERPLAPPLGFLPSRLALPPVLLPHYVCIPKNYL
jgi:hypothetical protein